MWSLNLVFNVRSVFPTCFSEYVPALLYPSAVGSGFRVFSVVFLVRNVALIFCNYPYYFLEYVNVTYLASGLLVLSIFVVVEEWAFFGCMAMCEL
jgi:hypothetical protein